MADFICSESGNIFANERNAACGRGEDTGYNIEERGLSRTVRSNKSYNLVCIDLQVNIIYCSEAADLFGHTG